MTDLARKPTLTFKFPSVQSEFDTKADENKFSNADDKPMVRNLAKRVLSDWLAVEREEDDVVVSTTHIRTGGYPTQTALPSQPQSDSDDEDMESAISDSEVGDLQSQYFDDEDISLGYISDSEVEALTPVEPSGISPTKTQEITATITAYHSPTTSPQSGNNNDDEWSLVGSESTSESDIDDIDENGSISSGSRVLRLFKRTPMRDSRSPAASQPSIPGTRSVVSPTPSPVPPQDEEDDTDGRDQNYKDTDRRDQSVRNIRTPI
ncbi:hypothetical protein HK102_005006 [Quaeritorhiza haematococci]|nr:hypothetical protein HK102_005006 [Quaeritorhiza haematococci]